jgi:hypothetical protein
VKTPHQLLADLQAVVDAQGAALAADDYDGVGTLAPRAADIMRQLTQAGPLPADEQTRQRVAAIQQVQQRLVLALADRKDELARQIRQSTSGIRASQAYRQK